MLLTILNYTGIAVFAASGALVGVRKSFDLWGILTVGALTGVGGGILRDLFLGITPPTSLQQWQNITVAAIASLVVFFFHPTFSELRRTVLFFDAIGMGVFASSGAALALERGASGLAAVLVGVTTAIGGGVLRDVLANEIPLLLQPSDLYAVPATLGALCVELTSVLGGPQWVGLTLGVISATALRLASLRFKWKLPTAPQAITFPWQRK